MSLSPFIIHALVGGTLIAAIACVLGCFVTWQRMAFLGDTLGHAALLGVAVALVFSVPVTAGIMVVTALLAGVFFLLTRNRQFAGDAMLAVLAHAALALGLVVVALADIRIDLNAYLFGDILAIGRSDIVVILIVDLVCMGWIVRYWRELMMLVVSPDIAKVEGVNVDRLRLSMMLLTALTIAVAFRVSGMLLVTALLVIPAAAARCFATTPRQMVLGATFTGVLCVWGGMGASLAWDTPSGPSVILAGVVCFLGARLISSLREQVRR